MNKVLIFKSSIQERLKRFKLLKLLNHSNSGTLPMFTDYRAQDKTRMFTLGKEFSPADRFHFCHESESYGEFMKQTGWPCSNTGDEIRGVIFQLPQGRFLAGWSNVSSERAQVDKIIFMNEYQAWIHADYLAKLEASNRLPNLQHSETRNAEVLTCSAA